MAQMREDGAAHVDGGTQLLLAHLSETLGGGDCVQIELIML